MMNLFTRRQAAGAALGLLSAGVAPESTGLRALTEAEGRALEPTIDNILAKTGILWMDRLIKTVEPACPGLRRFFEMRVAAFWNDLLRQYPNLAPHTTPMVRWYIDTYTVDSKRDWAAEDKARSLASAEEEKRNAQRLAECQAGLQKECESYSPTAEEIEEQIQRVRESSQAEFAEQLAAARKVWRKYPQLVECPEFPEPFLSAYVIVSDGVHPEDFSLNDEALETDFEQNLIEESREILIVRNQNAFPRALRSLTDELGPKKYFLASYPA